MKRGRNSTAEACGGSTAVGAGSNPVVSTISEQRARAAAAIASLTHVAIRGMAAQHFKSEAWVRRFLRHNAWFRPQQVLVAFDRVHPGRHA